MCAGGSSRARVVVVLAKRFASPKHAIVAMTEQENVSSGRTTYSPIEVEHVCLEGHGTPASSLSSIPIAKEDTIMDSFLLLLRQRDFMTL